MLRPAYGVAAEVQQLQQAENMGTHIKIYADVRKPGKRDNPDFHVREEVRVVPILVHVAGGLH